MWISNLRLTNIKGFETADIEFSKSINILVGANNSGKSTVLQSLYALQPDQNGNFRDTRHLLRLGAERGTVSHLVKDCDLNRFRLEKHPHHGNAEWTPRLNLQILPGGGLQWDTHHSKSPTQTVRMDKPPFHRQEPKNFIYPFFSKRKVMQLSEAAGSQHANSVDENLTHLYAKIDKVWGERGEELQRYEKLLGFRLTMFAHDNGRKAGILVDRQRDLKIDLEQMGEGTVNFLGLLASLHFAQGNLFLIEEPENDLHPKVLKGLLELILEKSRDNQFVITTHNNIVVKYLAGDPEAKIFAVDTSIPQSLPISTIKEVPNTSEDRLKILQDLGYDVFDFELSRGYLFLEESSAERIIRDFLIPWFCPGLKLALNTISCRGVSRLEPQFSSFHHLFLFMHKEHVYKGRAWAIADGDEAGKNIISELKQKFGKAWGEEHFQNFAETSFERYYPAKFQSEVEDIFKIGDRQKKQQQKEGLLKKVVEWIAANETDAKAEFSSSAEEVIQILKSIQSKLF